jgi:hypothetical protein
LSSMFIADWLSYTYYLIVYFSNIFCKAFICLLKLVFLSHVRLIFSFPIFLLISAFQSFISHTLPLHIFGLIISSFL